MQFNFAGNVNAGTTKDAVFSYTMTSSIRNNANLTFMPVAAFYYGLPSCDALCTKRRKLQSTSLPLRCA